MHLFLGGPCFKQHHQWQDHPPPTPREEPSCYLGYITVEERYVILCCLGNRLYSHQASVNAEVRVTEVCTFSTIGAVHKIVRAAGCLSSLVFSSYSSVVEHWWLKLGTLAGFSSSTSARFFFFTSWCQTCLQRQDTVKLRYYIWGWLATHP